jgi:hypothetical protein
MATKKKGKAVNLLGDPPIIVTGGGGDSVTASTNTITIEYTDTTGKVKRVKAKNNLAPSIIEVVVTIEGQNSGGPPTALPPVRLSGFDFYNVNIRFET